VCKIRAGCKGLLQIEPVTACCHQNVIYFHDNGNMENKEVIKALAALAQPNRLQIFRALVVQGPQGMTPAVLAEQLSVPPATLSFHLKELLHADLVSQERSGRNLIYRAQFDRMNAVLGFLTQNCCQGQACLSETAVACDC
jgi:DNA-binding transcriptional ArsR family regulator